jgi:transcriptional regulator
LTAYRSGAEGGFPGFHRRGLGFIGATGGVRFIGGAGRRGCGQLGFVWQFLEIGGFVLPRGFEARSFLLASHKKAVILIWVTNMSARTEVRQGTLALMVLKTLNAMGPQHGYGIARRIEQTSGNLLAINHGTLYPVLLKLEQEGAIASEWGVSENNRRARFYRITRTGRKQVAAEMSHWAQATEIVARFIALKGAKA